VPMLINSIPSFLTVASTSQFRAPSARRMPISRRRCTTEYVVIPGKPTEARSPMKLLSWNFEPV